MQDMNDKTTGGGAPNGVVSSGEFNQFASESQNVIEKTGQTLSNSDLDQLGKGVSVYASSGDFYVDSGAADAYVISATGSKLAPPAKVDGMRVRFIPTTNNTGGAATVNVAALGVESIKLVGGITDPPIGVMTTGAEVTLIRRSSPGIHWEVSQVSGGLSPETVTDYVSGVVTYLNIKGGSTILLVPTTVVTKNSSETIGPTGSGADNIWTALNEVTEGASGVYLSINSLISMSGINTGDMFSFARDGDSAVTPVFNTRISEVSGENASGDEFHAHNTAFVPVNSSRVFSFYWSGSNTTINTINMALKGFVVPRSSPVGGGVGGGSPPVVTGYSSGSTTYLKETGGDSTRIFISTVVTEDTSETVGPTGSGAANIWTAMDGIAVGATGIHVGILINLTIAGSPTFPEIEVFARNGASAASSTDEQTIGYIFSAGAAGEVYKGFSTAFIPLDASRKFSVFWESRDVSIKSIAFALKGFIVDT